MGAIMKTYTATEARKNIYQLIQTLESEHEPVAIKNKDSTVIMIAKSDWNAIQETLYLTSIPDMKKSIVKGLKTPLSKCSKKINWQD